MGKDPDQADKHAALLIDRLGHLTYEQVQYVLGAVTFFWEHPDEIDHMEDDWWTIPFRVQKLQESSTV